MLQKPIESVLDVSTRHATARLRSFTVFINNSLTPLASFSSSHCLGASLTTPTPLLRRPPATTPTNAFRPFCNLCQIHGSEGAVLIRQLRSLSSFHRLAHCKPFSSVVGHSSDVRACGCGCVCLRGFDLTPGNRASGFPARFLRQLVYGAPMRHGDWGISFVGVTADQRLPVDH